MNKKDKKYSDELKARVIELISDSYSITKASEIACEEFGVKYNDGFRRNISIFLQNNNYTNNQVKELEESNAFINAQNKEHDTSKSRFIISWCQSETDINHKFLDNIEAYAKAIDADILIVAGRYRNPSSLSTSKKIQEREDVLKNTWHERVIPYLDAKRHKIHKHLELLSDVKIQPTASTPLSGLNGLTGLESCIVGHPRVHLKSLPVLDGYPHKLLLTTGCVSVENYTDTKVGKKSEFHHTYGFVIVELDGNDFHVRQVTSDDSGSFYDLQYLADNGKIHLHSGADAIVFGDIHLGETNEEVLKVSFDIAKSLKCNKNIIIHDVFDSHSISHHEANQPFQLLKREQDGSDSLIKELSELVDFFDEYNNCYFTVVRSNHDEFLDRWLSSNDWRKNNNKKAYLDLAYHLSETKNTKGVIPMYLEMNDIKNVYCLGIDESYRVNNIECGVHGHIGASGSRGSAMQFKDMNTKNITGHTHSPIRIDGHSSVGTLTHLRVGYNKGLSSWLNSNVVIYPNGKTQHIHIINNKYTTL